MRPPFRNGSTVAMRLPLHALPRRSAILKVAAVAGLSMALLGPAAAQFWPFGGQRQQQRYQQPRQQQYNPFGGWFDSTPQRQQQQRQQPQQQQQQQTDSSRAPPPSRRSAESTAAVTTPIVVMGDSMADWLGSGLEDAFADRPEFGIVRKHRTVSGLVRYDPRRDVEWAQVAREIIAADKPKFIVMMIGYHDRQPIRERAPTPAGRPAAPQPSDDAELQDTDSPEGRAKASAAQQNEEMRKAARAKIEAQQKAKEAQQKAKSEAQQKAAPTGPMEFHSEDWQAAYIRRIDATIAAMRSANVPVFWVGLPPQRNPRAAQDTVYLNELFRSRAERAGIVYVDIWDGFVDEAGRYMLQGPDVDGQTRRLRSGDTVYFTRAGARKLAHYVEREIQRAMVNRAPTVALPAPEPAVRARPGATRPMAGPVIPLTAAIGGGNELLGGGTAKPVPVDPVVTRVLVRGEPIAAPSGRADNFAWPRGNGAGAAPETPKDEEAAPLDEPATVAAPTSEPAPATAQPRRAPAARAKNEGQPAEPKQPAQRRTPPTQQQNPNAPRPTLSITPSAQAPRQGWFWR